MHKNNMIELLRKANVLLLLSIQLLLLPVLTKGYASWFVTQEIACYRNFKAGEVIMNSQIIDASQSRYPNIRLQASNDDSESIEYEPGQEFTLTISVPYDGVHDLQYVVETDEGGKMIGTGSGCEGRRASARNGETVRLSLSGTTDTVKVWAGWATGHEAVTLTPPLIFHKKGTTPQKTETRKEKELPQKDTPEHINQPKYKSFQDINPLHHPKIKNRLRSISKNKHYIHHKRNLHKKHAQFVDFAHDSPFLANLSIAALVLVLGIIFVKGCGSTGKKKGIHNL